MTLMDVVGRLLEQEREERGLSRPEMATLLGIDRANYSRLYRGVGNITLGRLEELGAALDLRRPKDILHGMTQVLNEGV